MDKLTSTLPPLRITARLEESLMRLAAAEDLALSHYVRRILERHCFGHSASLLAVTTDGNDDHASQSNAARS